MRRRCCRNSHLVCGLTRYVVFGEVALTRRSKPSLSEREVADRSTVRATPQPLRFPKLPSQLLFTQTLPLTTCWTSSFGTTRQSFHSSSITVPANGHCKVAVCVPVAAPVTPLSAMALQFTRPPPWAECSLQVTQGSPLPKMGDTAGRMLPICYLPSLAAHRLGLRLN